MMLGALLGMLAACGNEDSPVMKDLEMPSISAEGVEASPLNCEVYHRGDVIPLRYVLKDNAELGRYNIDIHHNFDHHTHSTEQEECPLSAEIDKTTPEGKAKYANAWVFNQSYTIPDGSKIYTTHDDISIPATIEPGDYHFMIRLTDKAGNQQFRSFSIKIEE